MAAARAAYSPAALRPTSDPEPVPEPLDVIECRAGRIEQRPRCAGHPSRRRRAAHRARPASTRAGRRNSPGRTEGRHTRRTPSRRARGARRHRARSGGADRYGMAPAAAGQRPARRMPDPQLPGRCDPRIRAAPVAPRVDEPVVRTRLARDPPARAVHATDATSRRAAAGCRGSCTSWRRQAPPATNLVTSRSRPGSQTITGGESPASAVSASRRHSDCRSTPRSAALAPPSRTKQSSPGACARQA